jgi:predicted enzyme related to lactoylglutathione lyase
MAEIGKGGKYMRSGAIYFEIQADDPNRAVKFYTSVFRWAFQEVQGLPVAY